MSLNENIRNLLWHFVFVELMVNIVIGFYVSSIIQDPTTTYLVAVAFGIGNIILVPVFIIFFTQESVQKSLENMKKLNTMRQIIKKAKLKKNKDLSVSNNG